MESNITFENIKNWCDKSGITLIKGFLNQSVRQTNMFYIDEDDYLVFLGLAKNNSLNEIIYSNLTFEAEEEFEGLGEFNMPEIILEAEFALPKLPEDIFNKLVRKIVRSDSYYVNHTRPSRIKGTIISAINEELENPQSFDIDMFYLEKYISNLFSNEFRVKKEKEYILKINDLKNQGKTKKAIISILGITEGIYDSLANK